MCIANFKWRINNNDNNYYNDNINNNNNNGNSDSYWETSFCFVENVLN